MEGKRLIVACVPVYNEEKTIAKVVLLTRKHVDKVIVCDDGSNDFTAEIAESLGAMVIRHEENMGKGAALGSLFRASKELGADVMVTLDGDGQHDPDDIRELISLILKGDADVVIGSRFIEENSHIPRYRRIGNRFLNFFTNAATKKKLTDTQSGFRAYSKRALEKIEITEKGLGVDSQILMDAVRKKLKLIEHPVNCTYEKGTSTRSPLTHGASVLMALIRIATEKRPLLYVGVPSAMLLLVGLFSTIWLLKSYLSDGHFSIVVVVVAMGTMLAGLLLAVTALILKAISRLEKSQLSRP